MFGICDSFVREACSRLSRSLYVSSGPTAVLIRATSMGNVASIARLKVFSVPVVSGVPGLICVTPAAGRSCLTILS